MLNHIRCCYHAQYERQQNRRTCPIKRVAERKVQFPLFRLRCFATRRFIDGPHTMLSVSRGIGPRRRPAWLMESNSARCRIKIGNHRRRSVIHGGSTSREPLRRSIATFISKSRKAPNPAENRYHCGTYRRFLHMLYSAKPLQNREFLNEV